MKCQASQIEAILDLGLPVSNRKIYLKRPLHSKWKWINIQCCEITIDFDLRTLKVPGCWLQIAPGASVSFCHNEIRMKYLDGDMPKIILTTPTSKGSDNGYTW